MYIVGKAREGADGAALPHATGNRHLVDGAR